MANLLALDWGTSSFRAYLLDGEGKITERLSSEAGLHSVEGGNFEAVLRDHLDRLTGYRAGTVVMAAGMITSRQGWRETEYLECPVAPADLAAHLTTVETASLGTIYFLPGVKQYSPQPDIIRGEECQLAGLGGSRRRLVILPGTHSKWVLLQEGSLQRFSTFMTGDLYQALVRSTILKVLPGNWSEEGFCQGVEEGYQLHDRGGGLLSAMFGIRARSILGKMAEAFSGSYLSGLLLGAEIAEAISQGFKSSEPYLIIANDELTKRYIMALHCCGLAAEPAPPDMAARGLFTIARLAKLL